jgi:hypothetical protein
MTLSKTLPLIVLFLPLACSDGSGGADADAGPDSGFEEVDWQAEFDHVFPEDRVVVIQIDFHDTTAYDQMISAANLDPNDTPFFQADFTFDDEQVADVGVRLKGNSSLWGSDDDQLKSFKVHFEEYVNGQTFHNIDRLNLNSNFMDPSLMRESLAYDLANELGLNAPRTAHAEVWVDGERYGLYTMVQQVDSRFLKERFGEQDGADDGNLYKCYDGCPLGYWGDDPLYYQGFPPDGIPSPPCDEATDECGLQLKTNEDDPALNDFSDIIELVKAIDGVLQDQSTTAGLEAVFDIDHFVRFQAFTLALSNLDSYFGSAHNFYLYHRPTDGLFQFVPWDVNLAFGTFDCPDMCSEDEDVLEVDLFLPCFDEDADPPPPDRPKPLAGVVSLVPQYRGLYCEALEQLLDQLYTVADQNAQIAELHQFLDEERQEQMALSHPPFDFTYQDFLTAQGDAAEVTFGQKTIHALGYFNEQRIADIEAQMGEKCP